MAEKVQLDLKFLIIVVSLLIIATMGSAYTTFLFFSKGEAGTETDTEEASKKLPEPFGFTYNAGDFTVNLLDSRGSATRYMRTGVVIAAKESKTVVELEKRAPQVRDVIISNLRGRTAVDVLATEGMQVLKRDVIASLNGTLGDEAVTDVYFTDFVVQ